MEKEAHLEGHLLISIGMMLTMLHEDRFIVPILKRVGRGKEREERRKGRDVREVYERRRGVGQRKKKRGVVYKGGVGKRSGYEVVVVVVEVGGWRRGGVVYKG